MHPYHVHRAQAFQSGDYAPRIAFAKWYLQKYAIDPRFIANALFTDEASFTRE